MRFSGRKRKQINNKNHRPKGIEVLFSPRLENKPIEMKKPNIARQTV